MNGISGAQIAQGVIIAALVTLISLGIGGIKVGIQFLRNQDQEKSDISDLRDEVGALKIDVREVRDFMIAKRASDDVLGALTAILKQITAK